MKTITLSESLVNDSIEHLHTYFRNDKCWEGEPLDDYKKRYDNLYHTLNELVKTVRDKEVKKKSQPFLTPVEFICVMIGMLLTMCVLVDVGSYVQVSLSLILSWLVIIFFLNKKQDD